MNLVAIAAIVGAATSIGTTIVGFYYVLHYLDRMERRIVAELRAVEERLNKRMDRLEARMDKFEERLTSLTIEVRVMQGREPDGQFEKRST